jgi:hypothetical protein
MPNNLVFFFRLLAWSVLVSLEAVVGLPWLSLWLGGSWIIGFSAKTELVGLLIMGLVLGAVYSLPLTVAGLVVLIIHQAHHGNLPGFTKNRGWERWFVLGGAVLLVGITAGVKLSFLTVFSSLFGWLIIFKVGNLGYLKNLWQKNKAVRLGG